MSTSDRVQLDEDAEKKSLCGGKGCCKKVLKFMFSHIGLCGMVVAYSVAGAYIFKHLEQTNEKQECEKKLEKYTPAENDTLTKLWAIANSYSSNDYDSAMEELQEVVQSYRDVVLELGYDGSDCNSYGETGGPQYAWSFSGSLLFSVTVITTIGYGNIAPKTFWGRLVCIAYAVLGIPLMLMCLANIGDVLADVFKWSYTRLCCCGICRKKDKNKVESLAGKTDVQNNNSPEAWKEQYGAAKRAQQAGQGQPIILDDDEEEEEDEEEKISVPLTVTMLIIGIYIFLGALLFGVWEGWDTLKASYFCFVTISTIGFGDVVPGTSLGLNEETNQWKMVGTAVYMLVGMAILSMCFTLIQDEIAAKFKWLAVKLGLAEKKKDGEEEEEEEEGQEIGRNPSGTSPPPGYHDDDIPGLGSKKLSGASSLGGYPQGKKTT